MRPEEFFKLVQHHNHFYLHAVDVEYEEAEEAALRLYYDGILSCRTSVYHDGRNLYYSKKYVPRPLATRYGVTLWEDNTAERVDIEEVEVQHLWIPTVPPGSVQ